MIERLQQAPAIRTAGAPWQNAYSESFNSGFRDEFLNLELFGSQLEVKVLGKEYQQKYNHQRAHSALGNLTPVEFAARCHASLRPFDFVEAVCATQGSVIHPIIQPILSQQVDQTLGAPHMLGHPPVSFNWSQFAPLSTKNNS